MTKHSAIGPSALHRLLNCPASHKLSRGVERKSSSYAAEGSVAHNIVEQELDPDAMLDERPTVGTVVTYEGHDITVDQDMLDGVDQMVAFCQPLMEGAEKVWVEQRVDMGELWNGNPPEPIFGTVDFGAYIRPSDTLYVVDFKYGINPVSPHDNPQAYAYALGACYELGFFPATVVIVIVQPRDIQTTPVKTVAITGLDLQIWADTVLKPGVDALFSQTAPFATGEHCRFCPVKINCPALYEQAKKISRTEFDRLPPDPIHLDDAELAEILDAVDVLRKWFDAVQAEASGRLDHGRDVPGYKLVPKRAIRKWTDEAQVSDMIDDPDGDYWTTKLKSPTQIQKLNPEIYDQLVEEGMVHKTSSGTTLVADHDPREAVIKKRAKDEFTALE